MASALLSLVAAVLTVLALASAQSQCTVDKHFSDVQFEATNLGTSGTFVSKDGLFALTSVSSDCKLLTSGTIVTQSENFNVTVGSCDVVSGPAACMTLCPPDGTEIFAVVEFDANCRGGNFSFSGLSYSWTSPAVSLCASLGLLVAAVLALLL